jgi:hypothetical protein
MNAGVVSLTGERFKGSSILDGLNAVVERPVNALIAKERVAVIGSEVAMEARRMLNGYVQPNMEYPYLLPVLDQTVYTDENLKYDGNVTNFRYVMSQEEKDTLLKRDDRIFEVMGDMFASIHDKKITPELNEITLKALEDDWVKFKDEKNLSNNKYKYKMYNYYIHGKAVDNEIQEMDKQRIDIQLKGKLSDSVGW